MNIQSLAGFTLVETTIALALGSVVTLSAWEGFSMLESIIVTHSGKSQVAEQHSELLVSIIRDAASSSIQEVKNNSLSFSNKRKNLASDYHATTHGTIRSTSQGLEESSLQYDVTATFSQYQKSHPLTLTVGRDSTASTTYKNLFIPAITTAKEKIVRNTQNSLNHAY